jgi:hypothetical protein
MWLLEKQEPKRSAFRPLALVDLKRLLFRLISVSA